LTSLDLRIPHDFLYAMTDLLVGALLALGELGLGKHMNLRILLYGYTVLDPGPEDKEGGSTNVLSALAGTKKPADSRAFHLSSTCQNFISALTTTPIILQSSATISIG
jgi:hypothetical protein